MVRRAARVKRKIGEMPTAFWWENLKEGVTVNLNLYCVLYFGMLYFYCYFIDESL
jgi:hypothetical protein